MEGIQFASENPTDSMFGLAKRILTGHLRVDGGYMLYHLYRGEEEDDRGEWKKRTGRNTEWSEVSEELEHQEHIHALVVADTVDYMTCEAVYEDTDALVHRITQSDSNVSLYDLSYLTSVRSHRPQQGIRRKLVRTPARERLLELRSAFPFPTYPVTE